MSRTPHTVRSQGARTTVLAPAAASDADVADSVLPPSPDARSRRAARMLSAAAVLLAVTGIGTALLAGHARRLGGSLEARAVEPGESPETVADPTDAGPFEPFSFGVIGSVRGDAAALSHAVETLAARGDVRFIVVLGRMTETGSEGEVLRIAAAVRDRGVPVVAVLGQADLLPERRRRLEPHVGAARWWFVHRECLFLGLPGDADDAEFAARRPHGDPPPRRVVVFTNDPAPPPVEERDAVVRAGGGVRVGTFDAHGALTFERVAVDEGATLRTFVRDVSLGVLYPIVRDPAGWRATLAVAAALVFGAVLLLSHSSFLRKRGAVGTYQPSER